MTLEEQVKEILYQYDWEDNSKQEIIENSNVARALCQLIDSDLLNLATCPHCGSIWVCWNWIHAFGGDRKKYEEANPHIPPEELKDWGHECWDCENCFETKDKVLNGIPYEFLKKYYRELDSEGRISKQYISQKECAECKAQLYRDYMSELEGEKERARQKERAKFTTPVKVRRLSNEELWFIADLQSSSLGHIGYLRLVENKVLDLCKKAIEEAGYKFEEVGE